MAPRFSPSLHPVVSLKHIVDVPSSTVLAVQSSIPIIEAEDTPTLASPTSVANGSRVNAIYLRVEVLGTTSFTQVPRVYMAVFKNPANNLISPNSNGSGPNDNKKFIIHQEMVMISGTGLEGSGFPRTLFVGVIKIPPRLRRFGFNDRLNVLLQNGAGETTGIANVCVQAIYKEFR